MVKLKKDRPMAQTSNQPSMVESRTMAFARSWQGEKHLVAASQYDVEPSSFAAAVIPRTITEQYWAVRALVAEVKLSERARHYGEMVHLTREEEVRRHTTLDAAHRLHEARVARLEKIIGVLILAFVAVGVLLGYRSSSPSSNKSAWPHFTIPILSPFTSVVEHEVSAIGFRAIAIFIIVSGLVVYMLVRHRISARPR